MGARELQRVVVRVSVRPVVREDAQRQEADQEPKRELLGRAWLEEDGDADNRQLAAALEQLPPEA